MREFTETQKTVAWHKYDLRHWFGLFASNHAGREPWQCHLCCPRLARCKTGLPRRQLGDHR